MSTYDDYYDEPRRYRSVRTRPRDRDEPDYVREETYIERGKGPGPRNTEMVYRGRDDSIEDIPRDFPPPGSRYGDGYGPPRRSKSTGGRGRRYSDDSYEDDRFTERGAAAAGAGAGYAAGRREERQHRHRDDRGYDSDYSRSPPRKPERRKSGIEEVIGGLGLGGLAAGILGNKDKDRDRSPGARSNRSRSRARSRRGGSSSRSRSRSRAGGGDKSRTERKWAQAAQAALVAGAVEAFRSRKEPGPWTGDKGRRIATAALGAGGIDGLIDRDPDKKSKRHLAEAVIGGLAANRLANGPVSKSRGRGVDSRDVSPESRGGFRSRSRSIVDRIRGRSQSRGRAPSEDGGGGKVGLAKGVLGAGAVAAVGKTIYDRVRSKSRKRRSPSRDSSADSYVPSRRRPRDQRRSQGSDTGSTRRTGDRDDQGGREVARGTRDGALAPAAAGGAAGAMTKSNGNGNAKNDGGNDSSDSSSTTDMEKTRKHMRGKELITAGLATVATIHAAHGVYSSMEAHEKRHRLVAEGEMSPEEARKKQTKAWIQDAAAVGIAALGIKGAFSEWKEMNEQRREIQEIEKRKGARRKKRVARQKQEEMERHERMMNILEKNPQLAVGYQMQQNGYLPNNMGAASPAPDQSGNPYASGQR
ncbi:hypothetical protein Slin14017_G006770 [Septoria linicola]|nr:hypothetical protein Slin14017_G006770 [Septoria linicola]